MINNWLFIRLAKPDSYCSLGPDQSLWPLALLRSCQLGCQMRRRNSNAVPRCHRIRRDIGGPIVSSMDENVGTKASPCFRNHCWSGLRRHPRNRTPVAKLQAPQRSLAIHWTHRRGHRKISTLSKLDGELGSEFIRLLTCARRVSPAKMHNAA